MVAHGVHCTIPRCHKLLVIVDASYDFLADDSKVS